jgi:DMSO/TMAO reductase YedYZ molybdopterin-dependent catalytic subunit
MRSTASPRVMATNSALLTRRRVIAAGAASGLVLGLGGCDRLSEAPAFRELLAGAEGLTQAVQRSLLRRGGLAPEYGPADVSAVFRANGSQDPQSLPKNYLDLAVAGYADWRLQVGGLVREPRSFSLSDLRALPQRTQITRHDCVEGWSCIGGWTGPPLSSVLDAAGLLPDARYIVFYCADELPYYLDGKDRYYESIDLVDAFHPQTILAHTMNGQPLPLAHGAPLRLRVERQLGYKMAKFIMRIEAVGRFDNIRGGRGGYWEDSGYEWYAGI